jgi:hypothetical protein
VVYKYPGTLYELFLDGRTGRYRSQLGFSSGIQILGKWTVTQSFPDGALDCPDSSKSFQGGKREELEAREKGWSPGVTLTYA